MANWTKYFDEADRYTKAAEGSFKKEKLGSLVVYNVLSMAVENYLTALCVSTGDMPEHSGITAMLKQIGKKMEIPEEFHAEARFINRFMNFCSLEVLETKEPTREELARMLDFTAALKEYCGAALSEEQSV
ncbi:HEPN domain-containing protein [uncultured Draconibacterium sp.]|uniref:HEPN domain-containing protein n=1 Tax=uncultured Draconibacterium sp. TaxID=1573823 RepID=UPI0025CEB7DD|nr:HEPN domain-containing protein [uncultured Draconibacterium sp.]